MYSYNPSNQHHHRFGFRYYISCYMLILTTLNSSFAFGPFILRNGISVKTIVPTTSTSSPLRHCFSFSQISRSANIFALKRKFSNYTLKMTLSHPASQSTPASSSTATAKLIPSSAESLTKAGERIRAGDLVSFPTETVYGLGCHALDPIAVKKVFQAKERPLTDPLIVHVNDASSALNLWDASSSNSSTSINSSLEKQVLEALTSNSWPGPLSIDHQKYHPLSWQIQILLLVDHHLIPLQDYSLKKVKFPLQHQDRINLSKSVLSKQCTFLMI